MDKWVSHSPPLIHPGHSYFLKEYYSPAQILNGFSRWTKWNIKHWPEHGKPCRAEAPSSKWQRNAHLIASANFSPSNKVQAFTQIISFKSTHFQSSLFLCSTKILLFIRSLSRCPSENGTHVLMACYLYLYDSSLHMVCPRQSVHDCAWFPPNTGHEPLESRDHGALSLILQISLHLVWAPQPAPLSLPL